MEEITLERPNTVIKTHTKHCSLISLTSSFYFLMFSSISEISYKKTICHLKALTFASWTPELLGTIDPLRNQTPRSCFFNYSKTIFLIQKQTTVEDRNYYHAKFLGSLVHFYTSSVY